MYQVGFGDCFLLSFRYDSALDDGRQERHLLIDFGSTEWPDGFKPRYPEIANDIAARTAGSLDAIVITHRHRDHLSGYANDAAADTIAGLSPKVVLRPWTEDPDVAETATGPAFVGAGSHAFARGLVQAQAFAEAVTEVISEGARGFRGNLRALAFEQLKNQEAITRLDALAQATSSGGDYLFAGQPSRLEALLPGVTTSVLGPPTIEQWPQVAGSRADDPEYWIRQRGLLASMLETVDAPTQAVRLADKLAELEPGPMRWIVERLYEQQTHSLLRIVRTLDDALNNTSLILVFQTGTRTLLFPGDAQIENWSFAFSQAGALAPESPLEQVDLYKVGHHGSRNASPRSLVGAWGARAKPLTSLMSTKPGVHGESEETAVPRTTLCEALAALGTLARTDEYAQGVLARDIAASTQTNDPFAVVSP